MSWNYRIVDRPVRMDNQKEREFAIHEAYYDSAGNPIAITENPTYLCAESVIELLDDIDLIQQAFERPILQWEDLPS